MSLRLASFAAVLALSSAGQAAAQSTSLGDAAFHATTLHLSAYGEVKIKPDMATLDLGVTTEAATAQAAMQADSAKMTAILAAVRGQGVKAEDVQTAGLNLSPQYRYPPNAPAERTGYQATNTVTVRVRDLPRVGAVLDAAVNAGGNEVHGISFGLADTTPVENAAREAAVRALQAKAELYAHATGYNLLRLVSLGEGGAGPVTPQPMMMAAQRMQATPVAPGELTVRETISGTYELGR
ncbi:MAG: DUF541 domain-containing protein [Phenylobacterium sp.]|nr:MAG: DUF541 domain-containing protein [Phenylobacterium sp.]